MKLILNKQSGQTSGAVRSSVLMIRATCIVIRSVWRVEC